MVLAGLLLLLLVFEADACYTGHGPDQPWGLVCKGGPNSLQLSASVDARAADLVSFELAPNAAARDANVARDQSQGRAGAAHAHAHAPAAPAAGARPTVHYTLAADAAGRVSGRVPGLAADTECLVAARAHRRGCAEDGGNGTWSTLRWSDHACRTGGSRSGDSRSAGGATAQLPGPPTHHLEVFRFAEAERTLPDFLDNHDSGDAGGDGAIASNLGAYIGAAPITRYCVEVLKTTVPNTTTTTFRGAPAASRYADYRSTNAPWVAKAVGQSALLPYGERAAGAEYASWCAMVADRYIGHLSRGNIVAAGCDTSMASPTFQLCRCSQASAAASRRYTGMMQISVPIIPVPAEPGVYPGPTPAAMGHWYSHPVAGRCRFGEDVGKGGCTWQRAPQAHSIYFPDLLALGWDATPFNASGPSPHQPAAQTTHNVGVFRAAWRALGLGPCGGTPPGAGGAGHGVVASHTRIAVHAAQI